MYAYMWRVCVCVPCARACGAGAVVAFWGGGGDLRGGRGSVCGAEADGSRSMRGAPGHPGHAVHQHLVVALECLVCKGAGRGEGAAAGARGGGWFGPSSSNTGRGRRGSRGSCHKAAAAPTPGQLATRQLTDELEALGKVHRRTRGGVVGEGVLEEGRVVGDGLRVQVMWWVVLQGRVRWGRCSPGQGTCPVRCQPPTALPTTEDAKQYPPCP